MSHVQRRKHATFQCRYYLSLYNPLQLSNGIAWFTTDHQQRLLMQPATLSTSLGSPVKMVQARPMILETAGLNANAA